MQQDEGFGRRTEVEVFSGCVVVVRKAGIEAVGRQAVEVGLVGQVCGAGRWRFPPSLSARGDHKEGVQTHLAGDAVMAVEFGAIAHREAARRGDGLGPQAICCSVTASRVWRLWTTRMWPEQLERITFIAQPQSMSIVGARRRLAASMKTLLSMYKLYQWSCL